jgi:hypothetical protein
MALPDNFSPWEQLQSTVVQVFKKDVIKEFSDLGKEDWSPDLSTTRGNLRVACTPVDNDTAAMLSVRMQLFYFGLRRAADLQPPVYGVPIWDFQAMRKFRPQIYLYFTQDKEEMVTSQLEPVRAQISFRLMDQTSTTLSKTELETYAKRIKKEFKAESDRKWFRGRNMCTYHDIENGYDLRIQTDTKDHAKDLIHRLLAIQEIPYDGKFLNYKTNEEPSQAFPANPPEKTILGKPRKQPITRRVCTVRFRYAVAYIHGLMSPIPLYDLSGRYIAPLVI